MPENGEIPSTGDPRVDAALQRIRGRYPELVDAWRAILKDEQVSREQRERSVKDRERWLRRMSVVPDHAIDSAVRGRRVVPRIMTVIVASAVLLGFALAAPWRADGDRSG